ncbi:hypothetical protein BH11MYX2_BH11MYX2_37900 [soil metagenome]
MMRVIAIALLGLPLAAGCLTTDAPSGFVARRHACTSLEGQTFVSSNIGSLALSIGDQDFSTYEWTRPDATVTNGLIQCETVDATTLIYADVAELASGRFDDRSFAQMIWFGDVAVRQ